MDPRIEQIREYYTLSDRACALSLKLKEKKGNNVACRQCQRPACCRQEVRVYHEELTGLAHATREHPGLTEKVVKWAKDYLKLSWLEMQTPLTIYEQRMWCPFLEKNQCIIYNERPLVCRTLWVFAPNEATCNNDPDCHPLVQTMDVYDLHKSLDEHSNDQVWPMALSVAAMCSDDETFVDKVVEVITRLRKLWTQQDADEQDPVYQIHRSNK